MNNNTTKVLIADDSAFMRTVLKDIVLQSKWAGSEVLEAENGEDALELFKQHKPDLIVLDIIMPKKDGIQVLRDIGGQARAVVIVSSVGKEKAIEEAKNLGVRDYIVKPFDAQNVISVIDKLFS